MFRTTNTVRALVATAFLAGALPAHATTYKVGVGTGCSATTVQAAVDLAVHRSTPSDIYIATNQTYSNQAINVTAVSGLMTGINFIGGVPDCKTLQPSGTTSLNGGSGGPVITVRGTMDVKISHLTLTGGHGSNGGGIDYAGVGTLNIDNSSISENSASGNGGGIRFEGNGGAASMVLNTNTVLIGNVAGDSGGGIALQGKATMTMDAPGTWVALNEATNGFGGGIVIGSFAIAYIGSPGYTGGAAAIYANQAKYGGGIAINGGNRLYLYTTDPLHPVALDNNTALNTGGALYANYGFACLENFRLTNNIAQEGTAIYDEGAVAVLNKDNYNAYTTFCTNSPPTNSVACDSSVECNSVHDNIAVNVQSGNAPTNGSTFLLQSENTLYATNVDFRRNQGGHAVRLVGSDTGTTSSEFTSCLFADNVMSEELLFASGGHATLNLSNCTLAHDTIGGVSVIVENEELGLHDSIIDEGSIPAITFSGDPKFLFTQYNLAYDTTGFAPGLTNMHGRPIFVDAPHGDYRLFYGIQGGQHVKSLGLDYAPPVTGDDRDIRGEPRDQAIYDPMYGDRDLGAYEMQGIGDRLFIDTFGDDVLLVR